MIVYEDELKPWELERLPGLATKALQENNTMFYVEEVKGTAKIAAARRFTVTDLRKLAKGQDCLIRVPGYCTFDPTTVVLCHYRLMGMSGIGFKSPDLFGAYGCAVCHAIVDRQQKCEEFHPFELRLMLAEAVFRTQAVLIDKGILRW